MARNIAEDLSGLVAISHGEWRPISGDVSDVWRGVLTNRTSNETYEVAIKAIRCSRETSQEAVNALRRAISREVRSWVKLAHPNVLRMYGRCNPTSISERLDPRLYVLVSPYCEHGNVREYLAAYPTASRMNLVKHVSVGLEYLHNMAVVHGDLKTANILVSSSGRAMIADFGLSRILGDPGFTTRAPRATTRFSAPELLLFDPDEDENAAPPPVTVATDVWAFAMTALEILSGSQPFPNIVTDVRVISVISAGSRPNPAHYGGVSAVVWPILQRCWVDDPFRRPLAAHLRADFAPL